MSEQTDQSTSLSLIQRVRVKDNDAWYRLIQLYGPLICRWAKRAGLNEADITDVAQNVYIALSGSIDKYQAEQGDFRSWLWGLTRYKILEYFRALPPTRAAGGQTAQNLMQQIPDEYRDWDESQSDDYLLLNRALDLIRSEFEQTSWQAFWRMAIKGDPAREIAADLGLTTAAVRQAKFRITRRLRLELDDPELFSNKSCDM